MTIIFQWVVRSRPSRCFTQVWLGWRVGLCKGLTTHAKCKGISSHSAFFISNPQLTRHYKIQWLIRILLKIQQALFYGCADWKRKDFWIFLRRTCLHLVSGWLRKFLCVSDLGWFHNGPCRIAWIPSEQVSLDLFTPDSSVDFIALTLAPLFSLSWKTYSVLLELNSIPTIFRYNVLNVCAPVETLCDTWI